MIPYGRQQISETDIDSVIRVLKSDFLTQGPCVPEFERRVRQYCGAQGAVALNSATSALHVACLALGLGSGDYLWTTPNTFVASANCGLYCGAKINFVDIDPDTYNISIPALKSKLEQAEKDGLLPKVLVAVHFAGQPSDICAIHELSKHYKFSVIEDASHAIGATYSEPQSDQGSQSRKTSEIVRVGSCRHSDITIFSFHPVKIITSGEGGMALTNNDQLAARMRRLRTHGITTDRDLMSPRDPTEIWNYQQIELGFNYRMTDIQAALGLSQMDRLHEFVRARQHLAHQYDEALSSLPIRLPAQRQGTSSSYHLYPIRVPRIDHSLGQKDVYDALVRGGVAANVHYIPVHRHPYFENLGFAAGDFPEAEKFHREAISLPIFPDLEQSEQALVVELLSQCFNSVASGHA